MAKLEEIENLKGMRLFWCPGCHECHRIAVDKNDQGFPVWQWNGNAEKPTINPSVMVEYRGADKKTVCHSFIRDGKIQYLSDCTHELAGKTVEMVDLNDVN